jgi:hypothetical protein
MSFSPGIYYNPAPILAGTMAGAEGLSRGLQSAGQALGAGITGSAEENAKLEKEHKMTTEELDFLGASADTLQKQGAITLEDLQKFNSGSIGSKRAIVSAGGAVLHQKQKQAEQAAEFTNAKEVARINHPDRGTFTPAAVPITDPKDPNKVLGYAMTTSNSSAIPFNPLQPLEPGAKPYEVIELEDGNKIIRDTRTGKAVPHSAIANPQPTNAKSSLMDIERAAIAKSITKNQTDIDSLSQEVLKGNQKFGPDWMPWFATPYAKQIGDLESKNANLQDQMKMLGKGSQPVSQAPIGQLVPRASEASAPKQLTPDIAAGFLRQAGGDRAKAKELAKKAGY